MCVWLTIAGVRAEVKIKAKEKKMEPKVDNNNNNYNNNNRSLPVREEQQKGDVGEADDDGDPKQVIRVGPENTQVRLGENVYLCCIVDHQKGKAQWTKDGFALGECDMMDSPIPQLPLPLSSKIHRYTLYISPFPNHLTTSQLS
ncbi:hypothetical protein Pcinc_028297 [Petrolisthes cinctipes]|uniref:Ig-like domain-containing protein n=1 Tax=Petrolisthes cinctipes TaxID=88211 RepID=A0AAE1F3V6_PETCI|nr:hypothetical protein Pcinc_028297 [Petrolisthes cinctipes]